MALKQILYRSVWHRSLTQLLKHLRFWLGIRGDIHNRKSTPHYQQNGASPTPHISYMGSRHIVDNVNSLKCILGCESSHRQIEGFCFIT
jgi:hypothetical protein